MHGSVRWNAPLVAYLGYRNSAPPSGLLVFVPNQRDLGGPLGGRHALARLPDGAGLVPMDPAEVGGARPTSRSRADAPRATVSRGQPLEGARRRSPTRVV